MTRRLVITGTSHVSAFRLGWPIIAQRYPHWSVDFFAAARKFFSRTVLDHNLHLGLPQPVSERDRRVEDVLTQINGRASVDLADADSVLLVGTDWPLGGLARLMSEFDIDGLRETGGQRVMSRPMFDAICSDWGARVTPAPGWRNWPRPRLIVNLRPLPAEDLASGVQPELRYWREICTRPAGIPAVIATFFDRVERELAGHGIGFLRQPEATLTSDGFSATRFSRGARRLSSATPLAETDHVHMNAEFGALCLSLLLDRLDAEPPLHPAARASSAPALTPA